MQALLEWHLQLLFVLGDFNMTMSLRHFVAATAALAVAPAMVGSASAQSIPDVPVIADLLGGSDIPDIDLGGVVVVDLDVPADNGDPIDLTIFINSPTGESVELPGDVTVPLVEALLGGVGGGAGGTPDLPLVGDLPVVGALLDGGLPTDPSAIPVLGDLIGGGAGGLPTDPTALLGSLPVLGDLAGGGAGGLPTDPTALLGSLPVVGDLVGGGTGGLPTDPTALLGSIPVLGDLAGGGAGGLPTDPTALLGSLPLGTDTLFAIVPVDLTDLTNAVPTDLTALPIDVTGLIGGAGAGSLPIDPASLLDPAALLGGGGLPIDPTSLLGGGAGGLPLDLGSLPVVGDVLGSLI